MEEQYNHGKEYENCPYSEEEIEEMENKRTLQTCDPEAWSLYLHYGEGLKGDEAINRFYTDHLTKDDWVVLGWDSELYELNKLNWIEIP